MSAAEARFQQELRDGLLAAGITPSASLDGFSFTTGPTTAEKRIGSRTMQRRVAFWAMTVLVPVAVLLAIGMGFEVVDDDYTYVAIVAGGAGFLGFTGWFYLLVASQPGGNHYRDRVAVEGSRAAVLLREERDPSKRGF